jgi:FkbM family methyltransferase
LEIVKSCGETLFTSSIPPHRQFRPHIHSGTSILEPCPADDSAFSKYASQHDGDKSRLNIAGKFAKYLPNRLRMPLKHGRDRLRFRVIGVAPQSYPSPLEFVGTNYGGYVLPTNELGRGSICYCFGAGEDISFETAIASKFPVEVHIFDPTPRAMDYVGSLLQALSAREPETARRLHFHPWGVWSSDEQMKFYVPKDPAHVSHSLVNMQHTAAYIEAKCLRPSTIMKNLHHQVVDLVKLNIEGAEYEVMNSLFAENILPGVICINFDELHTQFAKGAYRRLRGLVKKFADYGYIPVSAEECRATFIRRSSAP